jgi:hypothetical protein
MKVPVRRAAAALKGRATADRLSPSTGRWTPLTETSDPGCLSRRNFLAMSVLSVSDARKKFASVVALDGASFDPTAASCWHFWARTARVRRR